MDMMGGMSGPQADEAKKKMEERKSEWKTPEEHDARAARDDREDDEAAEGRRPVALAARRGVRRDLHQRERAGLMR